MNLWVKQKKEEKKHLVFNSLYYFVSPQLTDWLTSIVIHSLAADSDLHTCITCVYVPDWMASTCMQAGCPRFCVSLITFTRRCIQRLPGPRTFQLSLQRIWIWLNSHTGETFGGSACMIDVGFVTLGIIRCNMVDSGVIAFERVEGNRKPSDSSPCFMVPLLLVLYFLL